MANIIVVSFKEETKAIEALHRIKELDFYGDITLYEHMMIRKRENNQYEVLDDQRVEEGWRTLTGAVVGGLLGAIVGPVGFVIGIFSGLTVGSIIDTSRYDFEDGFIDKLSKKMNTGTIAILAEVSEGSSVFIDDALKSYSSEIIRSEAGLEFDDYIVEQVEDLEDKIEGQREKLKISTAAEKAKINAKIADLKAKRKAKIAELETKSKSALKEIKDKTKVQIDKLESRLKGYENSVSNSYVKARANRIQKKINKQKSKLSKLSKQLEEVLL
ncbi:DUF1269 domain-containing protein [Polaribacter sp. Hel1_85]|uniref:DUF1269 domain-containing protein n=1 Tax=Polaribacter sp. Hel1_85 TaxID=1250005 RepID=UPI00052D28F9|nr:DUF1269 domain-containing protein [Polaribacter sp. Hel1_85]KGL64310.1 hypothetical protein PHEL85_1364 [Polaribacter sp. Hel1_85]